MKRRLFYHRLSRTEYVTQQRTKWENDVFTMWIYLDYEIEYGTQHRTKWENELHLGLEDLSNVRKMTLMERQRKLKTRQKEYWN